MALPLQGQAIVVEQFSLDAPDLPIVTLAAGITLHVGRVDGGTIVQAVAAPWFALVRMLTKDPNSMHQLEWRQLEELIATTYDMAGLDVTLTPRSGDKGRDVIATQKGIVTVRYIEQAKKYKPGHVVTANDVRAMYGTLNLDQNCTKAVITTTSRFAPKVFEEFRTAMPYRLELRSGQEIVPWLQSIADEAHKRKGD